MPPCKGKGSTSSGLRNTDLEGAVSYLKAQLPRPEPHYTRKHIFMALGGADSEWDENPESRPEGGPVPIPVGAPSVRENDDLQRVVDLGREEEKKEEEDSDSFEASFELPKLDDIAWFGVYEPVVDDDGHFHFGGCNIYSRPSKYEPLVRMHLLWGAFLAEYSLFKRQ